MSTNKIALGILAGFAAGTIVGILYAPEKGSQTRKKIKDFGDDYVQHVKDTVNEHVDALAEKYGHLLGHAETIIQRGISKIEEPKKEMEKSAGDLKRLSS